MHISTIPKSPPKIIRENTYTDSKGKEKNESVFIAQASRVRSVFTKRTSVL